MMDKNQDSGWDFRKNKWKRDAEYPGFRALVGASFAQAVRGPPPLLTPWTCPRCSAHYRARRRLVESVPPNYCFRLATATFRTIDSAAVRKQFVRHPWGKEKGKKPLYLEEHDGYEMLAVATKVVSMYNSVVLTHVVLMVVFPDPHADTFEPWQPPDPNDYAKKGGGGGEEEDEG